MAVGEAARFLKGKPKVTELRETVAVVVPWHNRDQIAGWKQCWNVDQYAWNEQGTASQTGLGLRGDCLILVQDKNREGCARTKNRGLQLAIQAWFQVAVVLDDDCFPTKEIPTLEHLIDGHLKALDPRVSDFCLLTEPPSRGSPHTKEGRSRRMEVAASMGFWDGVGDLDAVTQLLKGTEVWVHSPQIVTDEYFPLSGMNLAFRLKWWPWCSFVEVDRYDDIWMGWLWMKRAYALGCCFALDGPRILHSRQSDVWANLRAEAPNMEVNETLWQKIATHPSIEYDELKKLLPLPKIGLWKSRNDHEGF